VLFEWLGPIVEIFGYFLFLLLLFFRIIPFDFVVLLLVWIYSFGVAFSAFSLLAEEVSFNQYKNKADLLKLFFIAMIEPLGIHQLVTWFAFQSNFDLTVKKKTWGKMDRKGFESSSSG
jgi:hypothetical protein